MYLTEANYLPMITEEEFCDHIEDDNFPECYGNPVCVVAADGRKFVCMTIELYERMTAKKQGNNDEPQL